MKKKLSWQVTLVLGIVFYFLAKAVSGVIGDFIGVLADILLLVGIITGVVEAVKKNRAKTKV